MALVVLCDYTAINAFEFIVCCYFVVFAVKLFVFACCLCFVC